MGALFSRNKNDGKKRNFKFWATSHDTLNSSKSKKATSPANISKSQPLSTQPQQQWTEVSLTAPSNDVFDKIEKDIIIAAPVPPPRRHKNKVKPIVERVKFEKSTKVEAADSGTPVNLVPVEETIIIPKKEPIHICDGTHHHVRNIVNGKVIHDTIITNKKDIEKETEKMVNVPVNTPKKEEKVLIRPKNLSTVSLPNFEELQINTVKSYVNEAKKKPKRHISVVSLPTHNKTTLSDATVARLENYMMRCKSFGQLPPKELLEKLQTELEFSSDSEESWDGVDDWDMEIMEHTGVKHSPVVPKSYVKSSDSVVSTPTIHTIDSTQSSTPTRADSPTIVVTSERGSPMIHTTTINTYTVTNQSYTPHHYIPTINEFRVPTPIEEDEDDEPMEPPPGLLSVKKPEGRRESIDDFFDSSGENPLQKVSLEIPANPYGRRGSDGFFSGSILKDLSLKTAAQASNNLLGSEIEHTEKSTRRRKSAAAALLRVDSLDLDIDEFNRNRRSSGKDDSDQDSDSSKKGDKRDSLYDNDFVVIPKDTSTKIDSMNKPTTEEHSNLLKFLKKDTPDRNYTD